MQVVRLSHETDFAGWRAAARALRRAGVAPEATLWTVDAAAPPAGDAPPFLVPRGFLDLAGKAILHRSDERFALLYRLLWRLADRPDLLGCAGDADVAGARRFAAQVSQAAQAMKADVRLRLTADAAGEALYAAWFEPAHRVAEAVAPFFARRFAGRRFSILTPDVCVHWNGKRLRFTPGADPADPPRPDAPDLRREPASRVSGNLPETGLIPELIARAEARNAQMVRAHPSEPSPRVVRAAVRASRDAPFDGQAPVDLQEIAAGIQHCRRCDLWRDATQGVAGEGPRAAKLMLVGEQPGDQEDLAGHPFVGPAGQVLDRALAEAGVRRAETYVTNAVKHFKHEPRGKRRIHKTPNTTEIIACRWWQEAERRIVRPRVIVALGASAALSVFEKPMTIRAHRLQAIPLADQAQGVVTYHPAYLLRLPDADTEARAWAAFVKDLRFAWRLACEGDRRRAHA